MNHLDFKKYKKIALVGGAFDPIHFGHLATAQAVYDAFDVEKVIFLPLGDAPHKDLSSTAAVQRYDMISKSIEDNKAFAISDIEIKREGKTYTVDTIREIISINGDIEIYFVMGADEIVSIDTWKDPENLLKMCKLIAVNRPKYDTEFVDSEIKKAEDKFNCDIFCLEIPELDISSTDLRNRIRSGKSITYLLPKEAENYIMEHNLYKEGDSSCLK